MDWYKIPEINYEMFLSLSKPLYEILEGKKSPKSEPDVFAKECLKSFKDQSEDDWKKYHRSIQIERTWTMEWGKFHQNLMGSFPGWNNYKQGHETGCDIGKEDGTCVAEIKNNTNTMNSDSLKSVQRKLNKQKELGKRVILIVVNGDIRHRNIDGIEWMSGRQFYEEVTGRASFWSDLLYTATYCFKTFKTFDELKYHLRTV